MMPFKQCFIISLLFFGNLSTSYSSALEIYHRHHQKKFRAFTHQNKVRENRFQQRISHVNPVLGTFSQRYFVDESYSKSPSDPVFLYICGEGTCDEADLDGAIRTYAKKYQAKLVALEHRYYGKSLPFKTLSTKNLVYLNTHEALEDLAYFQRALSQEKKWSGKWIAFGGSYPGSLAAYYRLTYPDLVVGALASSAPVMAKEDFVEYDEMNTKIVGPECASKMREVVHTIENSLTDQSAFNEIKQLFDAADVEDPIDFLSLVADVGAMQYGESEAFCDLLSASNSPLEGYAQAAKKMFAEFDVTAAQLTPQAAISDNPEDYSESTNWIRQWFYQTCTEYGYQQNAHPDRSKSTRSFYINTKYQHLVCHRLFDLSQPPNTDQINKTYYYPLLYNDVSNIYFTNGALDPWSSLSLIDENNNTTNPNLTYYLIKDASHCEDLSSSTRSDSSSLKKSRKIMDGLLKQWLGS